MSEDSCTIVSAEDELLHDFVNIDVVDDVLMHMTQGNAIETLLAARKRKYVERKYVFRRRRLLKLRSAVADDAGLTSRSLTRLSTCGNIARIAGVMFLKTLVHTSKFGDLGLRAISGKEWNMSICVWNDRPSDVNSGYRRETFSLIWPDTRIASSSQ